MSGAVGAAVTLAAMNLYVCGWFDPNDPRSRVECGYIQVDEEGLPFLTCSRNLGDACPQDDENRKRCEQAFDETIAECQKADEADKEEAESSVVLIDDKLPEEERPSKIRASLTEPPSAAREPPSKGRGSSTEPPSEAQAPPPRTPPSRPLRETQEKGERSEPAYEARGGAKPQRSTPDKSSDPFMILEERRFAQGQKVKHSAPASAEKGKAVPLEFAFDTLMDHKGSQPETHPNRPFASCIKAAKPVTVDPFAQTVSKATSISGAAPKNRPIVLGSVSNAIEGLMSQVDRPKAVIASLALGAITSAAALAAIAARMRVLAMSRGDACQSAVAVGDIELGMPPVAATAIVTIQACDSSSLGRAGSTDALGAKSATLICA